MVKTIVGMMGSSVASGSKSLASPEQVQSFLDVCKAHGIHEIDTARVYNKGKSEELLGQVEAQKDFAIATKAPAFTPGSLKERNIVENCHKSIAALRQDKVDIYYLHGPDRTVPLEEQCRAIGQLYKEGKFDRFGVSNISGEEVEKIHAICQSNGYVVPSVYQGGFNPIHQRAAIDLFPLLRRLKMNFYAYSPLAGGIFAKKIEDLINPAKGTRFEEMPAFGDMFLKPGIIEQLGALKEKCDKEDVTVMEATLSWFKHHSPLLANDGFILGASSIEQLQASLTASEKGPLSASLSQAFQSLWENVEDVAPANYYV